MSDDNTILALRDEIISLKQINEGLNLACDTLRKEVQNIKTLNLELINSLADEKAHNLNLTQINQVLEILRHKQDAKLQKIEAFVLSDKFDGMCAEFGEFDYTKPLMRLKSKLAEIVQDEK